MLLVLLFIGSGLCLEAGVEEKAAEWMKQQNVELGRLFNLDEIANWKYMTNLTEENLKEKVKMTNQVGDKLKKIWVELLKFPWKEFENESLKRQFKKFSVLEKAALPSEKYERVTNIISEMGTLYSKAKLCSFKNSSKCDLDLETGVNSVLQRSRDHNELKYYWEGWRNSTGRKMKQLFIEYVQLNNEAAKLNNFTDTAAMWLDDFEQEDFEKDLADVWCQLEPLYHQLHAYVRGRLNEFYGSEVVSADGPIPAHLLGNMWSQVWTHVYDITVPFPDQPSLDITPEMVKQGYTPQRMFRLAEEFFTSLNMSAMTDMFWNKSVIEKPSDGRDIVCHASAWDFYNSKDFRIKMCTTVNSEQLSVVHHEMGHVEYFMEYKDQPTIFKAGANSGFHEAIGDVMSLSVSTPKHSKRIGLLPSNFTMNQESTINHLFLSALYKVAVLPFVYLVDLWRWEVFRGNIKPEEYNSRWWEFRTKYQGIEPPSNRSEEDFDPGSKYHIASDVPYIRYFVSNILQFSFHKALCQQAGELDEGKPLHNCDIYQSTKAGNKLREMLMMGGSRPWPEALEVLTGSKKMTAQDFLDYYQPLNEWLVKENKIKGYKIGWQDEEVCS